MGEGVTGEGEERTEGAREGSEIGGKEERKRGGGRKGAKERGK